ncbi:hypothetical protein K8I28_02800, partial [bacterium]|nr:hypothetical protein [bacterium]
TINWESNNIVRLNHTFTLLLPSIKRLKQPQQASFSSKDLLVSSKRFGVTFRNSRYASLGKIHAGNQGYRVPTK